MKNNLFNHSQMKKYAKDKAFQLTVQKHDFLKVHAEKVEKGDFQSERSSYLYFYDFLRKVLGYKREENILFEDKEAIGRGKVEFVLKSDDNKFMVIELKDQNTDLDKPQARANDKRTPVDQAFSYAQHSDPDNPIDWVMVSNFKEFRLYNYKKRSAKCICFTYEDLLNKDYFKDFMLSFSRKSHIDKNYPSKILKTTLITEQKLESNFYQLFHETRLMLIKELEEMNDLSRADAVHYAQLILNRYMFIAFAEDTGLIPSQISTDTIITPINKGNLRHRSVWQRLNELFLDINEGNEYKKISAYNGGLFKKDLDFIKIRDTIEDQEIFKETWQKWDFDKQEERIKNQLGAQVDIVNPIYKNLLIISSFDFSSELDVNILGHIFENSIGDLEELKEDTKGRRKKEGIFYTPPYITDYICRNTIIPYLSKNGKSTTVDELIGEYWVSEIEELDKKVKDIRIVDPACGSGAFLNKAADVLVEIHQAIHEALYKDQKETLTPYFDHIGKRREILLNNIYGVDLNEESVEITKLSLFLKVCRKDLKLPNLDNNIKCGNSLIDDPKYTDKPFNWETEFPEIFQSGGFDVVIGNPPWGADFNDKNKKYIENNYNELEYQFNSYVVFLERSYYLLKNKGILGFITPPTWLYMHYFKKIRLFLITHNTFLKTIYLKYHAFEDVTSESSILCYRKTNPESYHEILNKRVHNENEFLNKGYSLTSQSIWIEDYADGFLFADEIELFSKFYKNSERLKKFAELTTGIKPYQTNKGTPKQTREDVKNKVYSSNSPLNETYKPYLVGGNITRYNIDYPTNQWLSYGPWIAEPRQSLDFSKVKIVIRRTQDRIFAALDEKGYLNLNSTHNLITKDDSNLNLKYILCILNSSLMHYIYSNLVPDEGRVFSEVKIVNLKKLPILTNSIEKQQPLIKMADKMLKYNNNLQNEVKNFKHWIQKEFGVDKLSKKLDKYYELSEEEFIDELRKKKVDTKSRKNREYLEREFNESLKIVNPLLQKIKETDDEIDRMVYDLYGLTEDEIRIIENSLNS